MKKHYRILAADDSKAARDIISEVFNALEGNFEIITADNGKQAVELAVSIVPDLILMDIIMPVMDGLQAMKEIRKNEITADIPIIGISSMNSIEQAFDSGANDFISKPFNYYELYLRAKQAIALVENIKKIKEQKKSLELKTEQIISQKKDIVDDIVYSKRIQDAILPTHDHIVKRIPEYFIINRPKNIVSGDFYWVGSNEEHVIVAVADCTGHGISGAFMTIAGTAFLNEIINRYNFQYPNEVLEILRSKVMRLLQQDGSDGEAFDGMDIALAFIDKKNGKLYYSGANNPLYLMRNKELTILKGDRMPVGIHINFKDPFSCHELNIQPGDMIYMFSDGYADQFGGPKGKKFRYKQFQENLTDHSALSMDKQKKFLEEVYDAWKGNLEQVDDMLLMGFRI